MARRRRHGKHGASVLDAWVAAAIVRVAMEAQERLDRELETFGEIGFALKGVVIK